jgi:hypothetical protein
MGHVTGKAGRLLSLGLTAALGAALCVGCSSTGPRAASTPAAGPSTVAQIDARLLAKGTAPGFLPLLDKSLAGKRSAHAQRFVPPGGGTNEACTTLAAPELFSPSGTLNTGEYISVADARQYGPAAPSWFEYIDVYPGAEAAGIVAELPTLIGRCKHFQFQYQGAGATPRPAVEAAAPMRGLGGRALYITVRIALTNGIFQVLDWVLIRSGDTLIWVMAQSSFSHAGTGRDALTVRLAQDAWRRYSAA